MDIHQDLPHLSLSEHVAGNFEQGFYIGEIIELVDAEYDKISYMASVPQNFLYGDFFVVVR